MFKLLIILFSTSVLADEVDFYRLGSTWDRKAFNYKNKDKIPKKFQEQAKYVGSFLGGTAFYLGKFNNKHIMATNYHVLPKALNCYSLNTVNFRVMKKRFSCLRFIVSFKNIDLSLFQIKVKPDQERFFKGYPFKFFGKPSLTRQLYGMGYTYLENPMRKMLLVSGGKFCSPFSRKIKLINDPDTQHPVDYKVWSMAIGCDFGHGDSGSPIINNKGQLVGLFWTGGTPKSSFVKNDKNLRSLIDSEDPLVWSNLSYMVPLKSIQKELINFLKNNKDHVFYQELEEIVTGNN